MHALLLDQDFSCHHQVVAAEVYMISLTLLGVSQEFFPLGLQWLLSKHKKQPA